MKQWQDLGQGRWKLTITDDENSEAVPSVYRGTKEEIADLLADSQHHANRRIAELKRDGKPVHFGPISGDPKPMTPNERMQTVADLQNPATVDKAFDRMYEAATGETPAERRDREQREANERYEQQGVETALRFARENPEYVMTQHNANTMVGYMRTHGMDLTNIDHYVTAFAALSAAKLLQLKPLEAEPEIEPEEEETMVERNAPTPKPTPRTPARISTGVRASDISGTPPRLTTRLKYSREQLENMSREDYKRLMLTDRAELEKCEEYYAKRPVRRAS
jgi:hypothetical protein